MTDVKVTPKKTRKQAREWRPVFIQALRNSGNIRAAAQAAGVSRETVYRNREAAPDFAAEWDSALEDAIDVLEATARQRAQASSDTLLIFLLKAHRPEKYRETVRQELSGPGGAPLPTPPPMIDVPAMLLALVQAGAIALPEPDHADGD